MYPMSDGSNGQFLCTNGYGTLSWGTIATGTDCLVALKSGECAKYLNSILIAGSSISVTEIGTSPNKCLQINATGEPAGAVSSHASLATGVHGVGGGTIAKVTDICVDGNLSTAAQDAISKRHASGSDNQSFLTLGDTPTTYADKNGCMVVVNASCNGLTFVTPSGGTNYWGCTGTCLYPVDCANTIYAPAGAIISGLDYPTSDGSTGQVICTNGSGVLGWRDSGIGSDQWVISCDCISPIATCYSGDLTIYGPVGVTGHADNCSLYGLVDNTSCIGLGTNGIVHACGQNGATFSFTDKNDNVHCVCGGIIVS